MKSLSISLQQPQRSRNLDLANFSPTLLWKKYKLNFKDRVAQIILLVDCCLQSYFLRTAKYLALRTTKMATAADTTSWTSTNKHWIAFSQFLRSETKHIIRGYMDIGLSGQLINVTLNPYKETPTCVLIFLKLCMLKTKPNGSLGRSTGRANHCEH